MTLRAQRKGKPKKENKIASINLKITPTAKQMFYDIADAKGLTLTALIEEMIKEYGEKYLEIQ